MYKGYLCLLLHAHLPYVRHPEQDFFLEENWLYEAITETYIPLIEVFSRLIDDGVDFRLTMSVSPTLIEMFNDELLMKRYRRHLGRLLDLAEREAERTKRDLRFGPIVRMYRKRFMRARRLFDEVYRGDIVSALRQLQESGNINIITSAATHAFLPNLCVNPCAVEAQLKIGLRSYGENFCRASEGVWLPECGFTPGLDSYLKKDDVRFFFLETHGVLHGMPRPQYGVYAPILCPSGVWAFGRDQETSGQVWSSIWGYPGDPSYRDFYRDIGFDLDHEHTRTFLDPFGTRTYTGLKYYRITGRTDRKKPYVPYCAQKKAAEHARHFIGRRASQVDILSAKLGIRPAIVATYDAELFGHWWYEGPEWLENLLRGIHESRRNFTTITPPEYLNLETRANGNRLLCEPCMSSWGERGYNEVWLNSSNDYVYRHLHKAAERMSFLADRFPGARGLQLRALNQAVREVLLSQHSDWTFIMKNNSATEYAKRRFRDHIGRFTFLYEAIVSGNIPATRLAEIEDKDRIFQNIDYSVFSSSRKSKDADRT